MNVIDYITITYNKKKVRLQITSDYMKKEIQLLKTPQKYLLNKEAITT
jgi:hypothetical protein